MEPGRPKSLLWCVPPSRLIGIVLVLTFLIRGSVLLTPGALRTDPDAYRAMAENLLEFGTFGHGDVPSAYRPPLYPLVLTPAVALGSWSRLAIGLVHLGLGLGTVWLTYWLGRRWGLGGFALVAAGLVALDPILVAQSAQVMTETLAALLAVASLALLTWASERPSPLVAFRSAKVAAFAERKATLIDRPIPRRAMAAGACMALAILCRPTFLPWTGLVALFLPWLASTWSGRLKVFLSFVLAVAIVLAPWAIRNQVQFGRPIVTTTHGGYTFLLANNPYFYEYLCSGEPGSIWPADELNRDFSAQAAADETTADRLAYSEAWKHIRREPGMFFYSCLVRVGRLWSPLPHLGQAWVRYAIGLWYLAEFGLAILGIWAIRRRGKEWRWLWAALLATTFTAVHAFYWTDLRMRAPLMPVVALVAAAGIVGVWRRPQPAKPSGTRG